MERETTMQVYYPDTRIYKRIMYLVLIKQSGKCHSCRKVFKGNEPIARSDTRAARYYHFECAERRRIADDESIRILSARTDNNN